MFKLKKSFKDGKLTTSSQQIYFNSVKINCVILVKKINKKIKKYL